MVHGGQTIYPIICVYIQDIQEGLFSLHCCHKDKLKPAREEESQSREERSPVKKLREEVEAEGGNVGVSSTKEGMAPNLLNFAFCVHYVLTHVSMETNVSLLAQRHQLSFPVSFKVVL